LIIVMVVNHFNRYGLRAFGTVTDNTTSCALAQV
jgi:hypothetical protein